MLNFEGWQFRVPNITRIDREILNEDLANYGATIEEPQRIPGVHSELITFWVYGGFAILSMMAAYYFGKRKTEIVELETEAIAPDGTVKIVRFRVQKNSVEPVKNQLLKQLTDQIGS